jgi:xylulokinase
MAGPLLRWLAVNEPAVMSKMRWALQPKDWLRTALGGEVCTDPSDACATALAEPSGVWDDALIAEIGLRREWFAPLAPSYAAAGTLNAEGAKLLGLRAGIVLAVGAGDTACAALGSGLSADGDALLTTGSGGQIVVMSTDAPASVVGLHAYRAATDQWYRMAAMQNVGVALEAVRGWLGYTNWPSAYDDAFSTPASARLTFLPYVSGERSPWMNPSAKGGWLGLGLGDTRGAMMRAAFEGVAFALRAGLDAIRLNAGPSALVRTLRLAGGGSIDPRWRQLLADVLNAELHALDCPNAATRGAAILSGIALGSWHASDLAALAPSATLVASPGGAGSDAGSDADLAFRHTRFIDLYQRNASWF